MGEAAIEQRWRRLHIPRRPLARCSRATARGERRLQAQTASSPDDASDEVLWAQLRSTEAARGTPERIEALVELAAREHPALPAMVADEIEQADLDVAWRDALILVTERILFPTPELRARVAASLLRHARALRGAPSASEEALWAAIWRYATLIPPQELGTLTDFLRPEDTPGTWQVALQSIENAFSRRLPDPVLPLDALRERVVAIVGESLVEEAMGSAERRALAVSAYCAAAALGTAGMNALTARLTAVGRRSMLRRVRQRLAPVERTWSALVEPHLPPPAPLALLREAMGRLDTIAQASGQDSGEE